MLWLAAWKFLATRITIRCAFQSFFLQFCCTYLRGAYLAKVIQTPPVQLEFYEISSMSGAKFKCILLERSRDVLKFADLHNYTLYNGVILEVAKKKDNSWKHFLWSLIKRWCMKKRKILCQNYIYISSFEKHFTFSWEHYARTYLMQMSHYLELHSRIMSQTWLIYPTYQSQYTQTSFLICELEIRQKHAQFA